MKNLLALSELKQNFGRNKKIPEKYEEVILEALSHFPELADTHIEFELKDKSDSLYGALPSLLYFVTPNAPRKYTVTIRERANGETEKVLFKNLPRDAQRGVIGHELGRIMYYNNLGRTELFRVCYVYINIQKKREMERSAGLTALEHGLGSELYTFSVYIRSIEGYLNQHRELDIYYLKPNEILQGMGEI